MRPAICGVEALVPPTTCHPARTPGKVVYTRAAPSTAAFQERSGNPRIPARRLAGSSDCQLGVPKTAERAPPVEAGSQSSFQTASVRPEPGGYAREGAAHVLKSGPAFRQSRDVSVRT